jgi:hypothetical protein
MWDTNESDKKVGKPPPKRGALNVPPADGVKFMVPTVG